MKTVIAAALVVFLAATSGAMACEKIKDQLELARSHSLIVMELSEREIDSAIKYAKAVTGHDVRADGAALIVGPHGSLLVFSMSGCVVGWMNIQPSKVA